MTVMTPNVFHAPARVHVPATTQSFRATPVRRLDVLGFAIVVSLGMWAAIIALVVRAIG